MRRNVERIREKTSSIGYIINSRIESAKKSIHVVFASFGVIIVIIIAIEQQR